MMHSNRYGHRRSRPLGFTQRTAERKRVLCARPQPTESTPPVAAQFTATERGWHGMTASSRHTQLDWRVYSDLGAGDIALVNVADYSPAYRAGLRNGSWVKKIDGKSFEEFENVGAPIGTVLSVEAFHPARGHLETLITLTEKPKLKRSPRSASRARVPHTECGRTITRNDRPKWLTTLTTAKYLSMAARNFGSFLCNRAIDDDGFTNRWSYQAVARELGVSRATAKRAIAELRQSGFLKVQSGRKSRRVNGYTLTWPASEAAPVVVRFPDRSGMQRAAGGDW
jgi:biotin operon repressor